MKFKTYLFYLMASAAVALSFAAVAYADTTPQDGKQSAMPAEAADNTPPAKPGVPEIPLHIAGSYLASHYARQSGDVDQAISDLEQVHEEDPDNLRISLQLEGMLLVQGRIDDAMDLAEDIDEAGSKDALSRLLLSLHALKGNDLEGAAEVLSRAAADSTNPQLWLPLMQAWIDIGRHTMEKPLTMEAVGHDVGRAAPLVNYHLALINSAAGFKDEAARNFKNAINDPKNPPGRVMRQLLRFYDQNDSPEALAAIVKEYREANPDASRLEAADHDMMPVTTPEAGAAEILYTMGGVMFSAGVSNDAAIYLQLALYIKPDMTEAQVALGDAYADLQQYDRSNEMYARVPPGHVLYPKAQLHIAVNDEHMGKLNEALRLLDRMSRQSPHEAEALMTKGDLLRTHSRYGEAVEAYTAALRRIPDMKSIYWPLYFARGSCYERQGKWPEAEKDFLTALKLEPDQPDVLNYLGFGWLERGINIDKARDMIARAVKVRPDDAQIVDSMGWALYMEGDYTASVPYLEKAVELLPGDPTVNDHLGDVYWRLGRRNEARFQWQLSLSFSPESKVVDNIHKKLKNGLPPTHLATTAAPDEDSAKKTGLGVAP